MRTAFFILMMVVSALAAMDIIFCDGSHKEVSAAASAVGLSLVRRRLESVALFLIATVSMAVILIVEVLA